jgi:hypothetical protein
MIAKALKTMGETMSFREVQSGAVPADIEDTTTGRTHIDGGH